MTNDEKVALVEAAKGIAIEEIDWYQDQRHSDLGLRQLNSWLAHQDTFKRHKAIINDPEEEGLPQMCSCRMSTYPCTEAVTTADLIVNGVKE